MTKLFVIALLLAPSAVMAAKTHSHEPVIGVGSLDVCALGDTVHLLISSPRIEYLRSNDGGATWSSPVAMGDGQPATIAKRGMDVQITAAGQKLVAVWPTAGSDRMGRGPMASAISGDGGRTWRAGPNPADDGLTIGHSFIDVAADASGAFHIVWLDSREGGDKGLRYARSTDGGATWSRNQTIVPSMCECCWNTLAVSPRGDINVLFRAKDPRDMAIVRSTDGGATWSTPVTVGGFNWSISACPHVGGGLAIGRLMHALVWTAKDNDAHGVYLLSSADAGATWSDAKRLGQPDASRPDLATDAREALVAAWDCYVDGRQSVFIAASRDAGATWSQPVRLSDTDVTATHARVIWTSRGTRVFWTEKLADKPVTWTSRPVSLSRE